MITATQAKEQTKERITKIAREFIINDVERAIEEAIGFGQLSCTVKHAHTIPFQVAVADLLERRGFTVVAGDGYYDIKWEDPR